MKLYRIVAFFSLFFVSTFATQTDPNAPTPYDFVVFKNSPTEFAATLNGVSLSLGYSYANFAEFVFPAETVFAGSGVFLGNWIDPDDATKVTSIIVYFFIGKVDVTSETYSVGNSFAADGGTLSTPHDNTMANVTFRDLSSTSMVAPSHAVITITVE